MNVGPEERSRVYANFAAAYAYPGEEALAAIGRGDLANVFRPLLAGTDGAVTDGTDWSALAGEGTDVALLREEFTRLFEAGERGPACPMHESHYFGTELETFEDLVRYYNYFGLALPTDRQVRPDHLVTELEFLHFLAYHEARAGDDTALAAALVRAQRDFISRHTGAWVPLLGRALAAQGAMPFFPELTRLLNRFLEAEQQRLSREANAT